MMDVAAFSLGLMAGLLLGGVMAGLWAVARLRPQLAVAEARRDETVKRLHEQKDLLAQARQELTEAFRALSGDALKSNNEAFLTLAKTSFERVQAEAKGDLAQRQQAITALVKPLQESLTRYEDQLHQMERARQSAYGGLDQHLHRLQQETGNLVKALRAPSVRGRWGEITLRRVAELSGMVAHCDFVEQPSVETEEDRKSTRLNSSHITISYAVFCLKKKTR